MKRAAEIILKSFIIVCTVMMFGTLSCTQKSNTLYVKTTGDDENKGTIEKPFATLDRAIKEVQDEMGKRGASEYSILIDSGTYRLKKPVIFSSEFLPAECKINIRALTDNMPVISGGITLNNWKPEENGLWAAQLPGSLAGESIRELFIGSERAVRARHPDNGYLRVRKVGDDRRTHFFFDKSDFPVPEKIQQVELIVLHDWSISRIPVADINWEENRLTAVDSIGAKSPDFFNLDHWEKNPRYFLENDIRFLNADFEWCYDRETAKIYLKLPEGLNPGSLEINIPVSSGLIFLEGTEKRPVKNIRFSGLAFKHSRWSIPDEGYCGVQACFFDARPEKGWKAVPAAIKADWAEQCIFENCKFENLGASGLLIGKGCKSCAVINSSFTDISGNGILIGEGRERMIDGMVWWRKAPEQAAIGNSIKNCSISYTGAQYFGATGIWCGFTANTEISNNEIFNLPYSGISIGWEWSPAKTPCMENIVRGNHIHHIMGILSDGGGIYMLGLQPGSKLIGNHIHDVTINAGRAESNGMFLDEGTTDVIIADNLIYNIARSPLRFHRATTNLVTRNYLFCTNDNPPIRYNRTNEEDIEKVENIIWSEKDGRYREELENIISKWNK